MRGRIHKKVKLIWPYLNKTEKTRCQKHASQNFIRILKAQFADSQTRTLDQEEYLGNELVYQNFGDNLFFRAPRLYQGQFNSVDLKPEILNLKSLVTVYCPSRNLRSMSRSLFSCQTIKTDSYGGRAFSFAAPRLCIPCLRTVRKRRLGTALKLS